MLENHDTFNLTKKRNYDFAIQWTAELLRQIDRLPEHMKQDHKSL